MPLAFDKADACHGAGHVVTGLLRPDPKCSSAFAQLTCRASVRARSSKPKMQHKLIAPIMEKKLRYTHRLPGAPHGGRRLEAPRR